MSNLERLKSMTTSARERGCRPAMADGTSTIASPSGNDAPKSAHRSKRDQVIDLLRRPEGASLADLTSLTGWLPHTTRAALTGLRKKGMQITRETVDGKSRYRIGGGE